jgi:hypothetical protein
MHSIYRDGLVSCFSRGLFSTEDCAPNNNCESMKCAISSSFQYCICTAIADRYDASKSPSYMSAVVSHGRTCITKSTRPVELIAFNLLASWCVVLRPVVLCLNTEYKVSSGIIPNTGAVGSLCGGLGFSGDTSVYPRDLEINDEAMFDLHVSRVRENGYRTLVQKLDAPLEIR